MAGEEFQADFILPRVGYSRLSLHSTFVHLLLPCLWDELPRLQIDRPIITLSLSEWAELIATFPSVELPRTWESEYRT